MLSPEAAVIAGAAALSAAGACLAGLAAARARRMADLFTILAGLVLSLGVLLHLGPEALSVRTDGWVWLLFGAALGWLAASGILRGKRTGADPERLGAWLSLAALMAHSTLDGAIYSVSFGHSDVSGVVTGAGLSLHEAPEGVVAMLLALQAGLRPSLALPAALLASSATTPLGWALANGLGERAHASMEILFALSVGLLAYVGVRLILSGARALRLRS